MTKVIFGQQDDVAPETETTQVLSPECGVAHCHEADLRQVEAPVGEHEDFSAHPVSDSIESDQAANVRAAC